VLSRPLSLIARACAKAERAARRLEISLRSDVRSAHEAAVVDSTRRYDMATNPDEAYYRDLYWEWVRPHLANQPSDASCLDLGCGQGRLTLPLAAQFPGGSVVGVDLSEVAIAQATASARKAGLANLQWVPARLEDHVAGLQPGTFDIIAFTEVSFFWPEWPRHMARVVGALKPGGLLIASFRSQYFDALCLAQNRLWDKVEMLLNERRGHVFAGPVEFSWQRSDEVAALLTSDLGLELKLLTGVGVCSGIEGDPHASVARPSALSGPERQRLLALEQGLGPHVPDAGRYMLAIAQKRE
jgi:SAM-dependent methyltransferase